MSSHLLQAAIVALQDDFISDCARLGRPLTPDEVALVRREQSLLFLEVLERDIASGAATSESVKNTLRALVDRGG